MTTFSDLYQQYCERRRRIDAKSPLLTPSELRREFLRRGYRDERDGEEFLDELFFDEWPDDDECAYRSRWRRHSQRVILKLGAWRVKGRDTAAPARPRRWQDNALLGLGQDENVDGGG